MRTPILLIYLLLLTLLPATTCAMLRPGAGKPDSPTASIEVYYPYLTAGEKLILYYTRNTSFSPIDPGPETITLEQRADGRYRYTIPVEKLSYLTVRKQKPALPDTLVPRYDYTLLENFIIRPGDDIKASITHREPFRFLLFRSFQKDFTGKGSLKFTVRQGLDSVNFYCKVMTGAVQGGRYEPVNNATARIIAAMDYLKGYQEKLDRDDYYRLLAKAVYERGVGLQRSITYNPAYLKADSTAQRAILSGYLSDTTIRQAAIPQRYLIDCEHYVDHELTLCGLRLKYARRSTAPDSLYTALKNGYSGPLKDALLVRFLSKYKNVIPDFSRLYLDALQSVKAESALLRLKELQGRVPGTPAYNFALPDASGKTIHLADLKGKVVFIDFWFTGCTYCEKYYRETLKEIEEAYKDHPGIAFVTISIDKNREQWLKSVRSGKYSPASAINLYTEGKGNHHPVVDFFQATTFPQPLIISKRQTVEAINATELMDKGKLKAALQKALSDN